MWEVETPSSIRFGVLVFCHHLVLFWFEARSPWNADTEQFTIEKLERRALCEAVVGITKSFHLRNIYLVDYLYL
jgi:hypothetical protein